MSKTASNGDFHDNVTKPEGFYYPIFEKYSKCSPSIRILAIRGLKLKIKHHIQGASLFNNSVPIVWAADLSGNHKVTTSFAMNCEYIAMSDLFWSSVDQNVN